MMPDGTPDRSWLFSSSWPLYQSAMIEDHMSLVWITYSTTEKIIYSWAE